MRRYHITAIILMLIAVLTSCNLDSGQGVFQMAHNATKKTEYTITDVYGSYDDNGVMKLLISRDGDLWATWSESGDREMKAEKIMEITQSTMRPIFINGSGELFYAYKENMDDDAYLFASAPITTIAVAEEENDEGFDYKAEGTSITPSFSSGTITKFSSINLDLDTCQIIYGSGSQTYYGKIESKSEADDLAITTMGTVDRASIVFGNDAVYSYYEDSDMEDSPDDLIITRFNGTAAETIDSISVDEDNIPMGYDSDGGYFITFDGDLYRFDSSADNNNGYTRVDGGFVSDLRYRTGHRMILSTEPGERQVAFIYRNGIYVNEPGLDTAPRVLSIDNNDNDIISTTYIGKRNAGDIDRYLFATQNNSFIILELGTLNPENNRYTAYSVSSYSPLTHGLLSEYL